MADALICGLTLSMSLTSLDALSDSEGFEITVSSRSSRESADVDSGDRCCCGSLRSCDVLGLDTADSVKQPYSAYTMCALLSSLLGPEKNSHGF